jgi:hypothetical protein
MADNTTLNPGVGGDVVAADDVGGVKYQVVKLDLGANGVSSPVSGTLPISGDVAPTGDPAPYWPSYGAPTSSGVQGQIIDSGGALVTRGAVLTDEGTFRANFANTSLAVSIGTVTVVGNVVTGTGFSTLDVHLKDYFKIDADAETAWKQIDSIDSDTQLTLTSAYVGSSSGAASRALLQPATGAGGSITVASGQCVLTSGTTSGSVTRIARNVDYGPLVFRERLSVSQRVANQSIRIGLAEANPTTRWFARFRLTGTDAATIVTCESGRNPSSAPSASETETSQVTIPGGLTTAAMLDYRIEQLTESVRFYINGVLVAENSKALPSAYDFMNAGTAIENTGVPASSTTVTVDYITVKNHNKLEIGVMSDAEKIVAAAVPLQQFSYGPVAGVIAINTDLMVLDCSQIRSLFIQCASMGTTGVVTVQWCNEPTFAQPITATLLSESGATSTTFNAAVLRVTNVMARYCRLRLTTATTAGTTTINAWGAQTAYTPIVTTQPVSGTVTVNGTVTSTVTAGTINPVVPATPYFVNSAATTNGALVLTGTSGVHALYATNTGATAAFVKLYNKATAPTVGTDVPEMVIPVPAAVSGVPGVAELKPGFAAYRFALGLGIAITGAVADSDQTAVAAGQVKVKISRTV